MKRFSWILALYLTVVIDVSGQSFTYITMGPNGETLMCTPLQGGGSYCVVQP